jgi:hypothetical protein
MQGGWLPAPFLSERGRWPATLRATPCAGSCTDRGAKESCEPRNEQQPDDPAPLDGVSKERRVLRPTRNEKSCVIFSRAERGANNEFPCLIVLEETRNIMWQSPCSSLLHALASLGASQPFDEKSCVGNTELLSDKQHFLFCFQNAPDTTLIRLFRDVKF